MFSSTYYVHINAKPYQIPTPDNKGKLISAHSTNWNVLFHNVISNYCLNESVSNLLGVLTALRI